MDEHKAAGLAFKSDLAVNAFSDSLSHKSLDVIVTGSIAAVESVRFIRALRRLGARVRVVATQSACNFVGALALEWASAGPVQTDFSGTVSHLAENDALVVAPASANFLTGIARGESDTAAKALVQSYLGAAKPVLILPCMHESLEASPFYQRAIASVGDVVTWLRSRNEEGKNKFPEPHDLADHVSHALNYRDENVLVTMGGTRAYVDDVRYVGNLSTGALGSEIAQESYRQGFSTHVICAAAEYKPRCYNSFTSAITPQSMNQALDASLAESQWRAAIFAAAVSDYEPVKKEPGKIRSDKGDFSIRMTPTMKLLEQTRGHDLLKIGFKLEPTLNERLITEIFSRYQSKYQLDAMILNQLEDIGHEKHRAWMIDRNDALVECRDKRHIAQQIFRWLKKEL